MRRVLMLSPHFPPDTSAGTHRVRLLAPHLPKFGWEPTVVTVDPADYEGRLDSGLLGLVPANLRVLRYRIWPVGVTRRLGFGDLGLRACYALNRACVDLMRREPFDALFITIYPAYTALIGPGLKEQFGVPFVLDYQDPWVGEWGLSVGGGPNGEPDLRSRMSRSAAQVLEPIAACKADAITAVSAGTFQQVCARYPGLSNRLCLELPIGGEETDFEHARNAFPKNPYFDPADGLCHICYVGTLLPKGFETLRAVLKAVATLRQRRPELFARLRLRFFGTSNQTAADAPQRVLPAARELGVEEIVSEVAPRIDYLEALAVQTQASAILMMGSSERHYTASKLYPGLLAKRPLLAIYHEASSVSAILPRVAQPPIARLITYNDRHRAEDVTEEIFLQLSALIENPAYDPEKVDLSVLSEYSAEVLAGRLAEVLGAVTAGRHG